MTRREASLELWDDLADPSTHVEAKDILVRHYQYLVEGIARSLQNRLPSYVDDEELVSLGQLGLLRAISKYDPVKGPFSRYASSAVYGSIIDGLRSSDFAPRGLRKQQRDLEKAERELQEMDGTEPSNDAVAEHMDVTPSEVRELRHKIVRSEVVAVDPSLMIHASSVMPSSFARAMCSEFVDWLDGFEGDTQKVIALKYWKDLSIKNISEVLQIPIEQVRDRHYEVLDSVLGFAEDLASTD